MNTNKFSSFIRQLREEKGLNQEQLAKELYVHRTTVTKWENGTIPLNDTLLLLSDYFNVTIDELLNGERDNNKKKNTTSALLTLIKIRKKLTVSLLISITLTVLILLVSLSYYFFKTYNSIHVYTISGINDNFYTYDGLLVLNKEKCFFTIGKIKDLDNNEITFNNIKIYYKTTNDKEVLFAGNTSQLLIETKDAEEWMKGTIDKYQLFMSFDYNEQEYEMKINAALDFNNKKLTFLKEKNVSESQNIELVPIKKLLSNNFKYNESSNKYTLIEKNYIIDYFPEYYQIHYIKEKEKTAYYYKPQIIEYYDEDSKVTKIDLSKKLTYSQNKIVNDFFDNCYNKYFK